MMISFHNKVIISVLIFVGLVFAVYSYFESRSIKTTEIEIKSADIPESFNGLKIVFISDIHLGPYLSAQRLSGIVGQINAMKPDLILLGGDYVHYRSRYVEPVFRELGKLRSVFGVYGVLGNHDHYAGAALSRSMMAKYGINSIDNQSFWITKGNDSIKIGGVGDLKEDLQFPEYTFKGLKRTDFSILVSHQPDYIEKIESDLIDLTLSGHTHGGQITFFGLWAPILPSKYGQKYRYGLIDSEKMKSYISSGVGAVILPFRFFCRPEIVVIRLKKTNRQ
ncbi:MAG: metallophosphoesterase [Bacteroidia bacterium]|nr:metallophosphoesterase [Bacteroidia bacterium]